MPLTNLAESLKAALPLTNLADQLRPIFEGFHTAWLNALPANWRDLEDDFDQITSVLEFMEETGWSLVWVPRLSVIEALLAAERDEVRATTLLSHQNEVLDDLDACLAEIACIDPDLKDAAQEAVVTFRNGQHRAAQALATNTFTTALAVHLGVKRNYKKARGRFTKEHPMDVGIQRFRLVAILRTAGRAIERYAGEDDEPIPKHFNRHASTHRVSAIQYTAVNSLASLMLLVSLLRELDHWLAWQTARQRDEREAAA